MTNSAIEKTNKTLNMKESSVFLIFPHQLFSDISLLNQADEVVMVEEFLFFNQYKFHKQKLVLHRASMKYYADFLVKNKIVVRYVEARNEECDARILIENFFNRKISKIYFYDVCDNWLEKKIIQSCQKWNIKTHEYPSRLFINTKEDLKEYFGNRDKYFHNDFYIQQRKNRTILVDNQQKPIGGKWSFDAENRQKYPKDKTPPKIEFPIVSTYYTEAIEYVEKYYGSNYGFVSTSMVYPTTHAESEVWLQQFFENRFSEFGDYEDAIVGNENILNHSILSPLLNIGLLLPMQVVETALSFASKNKVSMNSLEGFIRQIIGWREFIRGVYIYKGTEERNSNFWNFNKKVPASFYNATTGIDPVDITLQKVLKTAYCHHIERLMVMGNFMLLCEFEPDEVYRWFMEMFIDAYDWVMVPNVYGMSQFADGGLMATKPYISGSNYLLKMSNFKKGEWHIVWDALFWRFMNVHRDFFAKNPRLNMLVSTFDKMNIEKQNSYMITAEKFLGS